MKCVEAAPASSVTTGSRWWSRRTWHCLSSAALVLACGGAPAKSPDAPTLQPDPPEATATANEPSAEVAASPQATSAATPESAPSSSSPSASATDAELDKDIAAIEEMAGLRPKQGGDEARGRDVTYRVRSGELSVELGGLVLMPRAKAIKHDNGSYGVEVEVSAESKDGQVYRIASPSNRPLSIAGEIAVRSGEPQRFTDSRKGTGELIVGPGETRRFRQAWPARGQPKLWGGQQLVLEVGLWGVSASDERELPLRRLCTVKMTAGNKPQPIVVAPDVPAEE
jgi:hypothetical protein